MLYVTLVCASHSSIILFARPAPGHEVAYIDRQLPTALRVYSVPHRTYYGTAESVVWEVNTLPPDHLHVFFLAPIPGGSFASLGGATKVHVLFGGLRRHLDIAAPVRHCVGSCAFGALPFDAIPFTTLSCDALSFGVLSFGFFSFGVLSFGALWLDLVRGG